MGKKFMGTIRSTVLINKNKKIKIWSNVRVKDHAKEVLNFISFSELYSYFSLHMFKKILIF